MYNQVYTKRVRGQRERKYKRTRHMPPKKRRGQEGSAHPPRKQNKQVISRIKVCTAAGGRAGGRGRRGLTALSRLRAVWRGGRAEGAACLAEAASGIFFLRTCARHERLTRVRGREGPSTTQLVFFRRVGGSIDPSLVLFQLRNPFLNHAKGRDRHRESVASPPRPPQARSKWSLAHNTKSIYLYTYSLKKGRNGVWAKKKRKKKNTRENVKTETTAVLCFYEPGPRG